MIDANFWAGKNVLVTGHTGFKGSWLSLWLNRLGANVYGYALDVNTDPSIYEAAAVEQSVNSKIADIRNGAVLTDFIQEIKPDIVFHLAAQPIVRESFKEPTATIETNVMGTVNLLEAIRHVETVKALVVVTSDKCYDNKEWHWGYRENEALGGHDPYSASKACAELIAQSWRLSFMGDTGSDRYSCAVATARAGNVIGGGDWSSDRLIPDILHSVENKRDIILRNPNAVRPWQHVLEPLAGYLLLAQRLTLEGQPWAEAWNFGPSDTDARPVKWISEKLIQLFDSQTSWIQDPETQPHEAQHLKLDCSKARDVLGWSSVWDLSRCLEEIVLWQQAYSNGANMEQVSMDTLARYESDSQKNTLLNDGSFGC